MTAVPLIGVVVALATRSWEWFALSVIASLVVGVAWFVFSAVLTEKALRGAQEELSHSADPNRLAADRQMLADFLELFPADHGVTGFLRRHPWDLSFEYDDLAPLRDYARSWHPPDKMFLDPEMEEAHGRFRQAVAAFYKVERDHVFQRDDSDQWRVHPEAGGLDWRSAENEYAFAAVDALNSATEDLLDERDEFVDFARRRLGFYPGAAAETA